MIPEGGRMAKLASIYGGKPGRPGDMIRGVPPRPPRPPKPPKIAQPPSPLGVKKPVTPREKGSDDHDGDGEPGHTPG